MHTLDKNQPFLLVDDIDVHYGPVQALFGVSLHVQAGEVVSVLGGNASGKSTTLKSVLGLVHPSRGRILLEGQAIHGLSSPDVIERGVASVPEGRRVFPEMSVYENLLMGAYPRRRDKQEIERDLEEVFASFPRLAERRKQAAGTLSGGEQQMLALGRAWLRRGKLICIDEPSMGLSPKFVDLVYEVLFRWKAAGQTLLLVEQNARIALELADRAYVLQHGHVILQGGATELAADPTVQKAYLGAA
ncbi:ABC transporter ATP-binding protein [Pusillimonas sp.]|uniref:ABC transporter ATP-binding protein n=1 Tax=Pusillimonas sp. TaxID=3040095 RepID=UPI0029A0FCD7|nr:ABC transporter ATP-binding protein [Pusillimonas sp.]MDX3894354.1 ABC transporter ATP-binding protein [Pusillimonas sp.]